MSIRNDVVNDFYLYVMLIKLVFIFNAYLYIQCIFIKYFVFARQWSYFSEATNSISPLLRFRDWLARILNMPKHRMKSLPRKYEIF